MKDIDKISKRWDNGINIDIVNWRLGMEPGQLTFGLENVIL